MDKAEQARILELVKSNYEEIAGDFDISRRKEVWPQMRTYAGLVKGGNSVLDIGCGNGRLLEALTGRQIDYLGADSSSALIDLARKNYPERRFLSGDILELDQIPAAGFDFIFCLAVLQHIPGKDLRLKALKELRLKLAPQGKIVISAWNLWSPAWPYSKYRAALFRNFFLGLFGRSALDFGDIIFPWKNSRGEVKSARYYHAFRRAELSRLFRQAGLAVLELKKDKYNYWALVEKDSSDSSS